LACASLIACGSRTPFDPAATFVDNDGVDSGEPDAHDADTTPDVAVDVREPNPVLDAGMPSTTLVLQVPGTANLYRDTNPAPGDSPPVLASGGPVCPATQVHVTATGCVVSEGPNCIGPNGDNSWIFNGLPVYSLIGQWGRSPNGLTAATAVGKPFFVGSTIVLVAPAAPGSYFLYLGENDGMFSDNSAAYSVTVSYAQSAPCQ
jgi:hypothetical protein